MLCRAVQIINVSRYAIIGYGVFMGVLAIILQEIGLNLGWVYLFMVRPPAWCLLLEQPADLVDGN